LEVALPAKLLPENRAVPLPTAGYRTLHAARPVLRAALTRFIHLIRLATIPAGSLRRAWARLTRDSGRGFHDHREREAFHAELTRTRSRSRLPETMRWP
jgi:hypothetical protein